MILAVAAGGAIGTIARYMVAIYAGRWLGTGFPWGTLLVNVTGSFLIGALAGAFALKWDVSQATRAFLIVGICGGYTTFSAFSLDFVTLMNRGQAFYALAYAIGSSALSIVALYAALRLMRIVLR
jgi:fluoride exporter